MGNRPRKPRSDWFDTECMEAIGIRDQSRKIFLGRRTRSKEQDYIDARKKAKRVIRKKKKAYINDIMLKAEQNFKENNPRET